MNSVGRLRNSSRLCYKQCATIRKENLQFDVGIIIMDEFLLATNQLGHFKRYETN